MLNILNHTLPLVPHYRSHHTFVMRDACRIIIGNAYAVPGYICGEGWVRP